MASKPLDNTQIQCPYHAERYGNVREIKSCIVSVSSCKPGKIF